MPSSSAASHSSARCVGEVLTAVDFALAEAASGASALAAESSAGAEQPWCADEEHEARLQAT
jgi:hypothetical protein